MTRPDERWIHGDTGQPYWRESTAHEDRFIVIHGAPEPVQDAPGRTEAAQVDVAATPPEPTVAVTRGQRIRNLMSAVRSGDRSAADALREALMGD